MRTVTRGVCLAVAAMSTSAAAEPSHRELGAAHYAKGNFAAAAAEFRLCIATDQGPDCSFALAQSLRVLGDCPGAVRSYNDFLATRPEEAKAQAARDAITACGGTIRPVEPAPPEPPAPAAPPTPVPAEPAPRPPRERRAWYRDRLALAGLISGGVATAAGAATLWLSARAHDDAARLGAGEGTLPAFEDKLDEARRYRWIGAVSLGVGGALLVAATVKLLATDDDGGDAGAATAGLSVTGAGVMVSGSLPF